MVAADSFSSPLDKKRRNLLGGNRSLANHAPTFLPVAEIDDGRCNFAGGGASIDDDGNAILQLVAGLPRGRAFRSAAEVRRGGCDGNAGRLNDRQRNLGGWDSQGNIACI